VDTSRFKQFDFSAGVQTATSFLLRRSNEVEKAVNSRFDDEIGGIVSRKGYTLFGSQVEDGKDGLGLHVSNFDGGSKLLMAIDNAGSTETRIYHVQSGSNTQLTMTEPDNGTEMQFVDAINETYVVGYSATDDSYMAPHNIQEDLTASQSRNLTDAPDGAKFVASFDGLLLLMNVKIGSDVYPDRIYKGFPKAEVTFIRGDQSGTLTTLEIDSTRFIKVGQVVDIYTAGTDTKVEDSITVASVDKANNKIGFTSRTIDVSDNDEIWLEDRKDEFAYFFNSTAPTPEQSDFIRIPQGRVASRAITGHAKSNNRLFIFTKSSTIKISGRNGNPVILFDDVGCISHKSIQSIGDWLIWLDASGNIRGYNDSTGQFDIISKAVKRDYLELLTQAQMAASTSGSMEDIYKIYIGTVNGKNIRLVYEIRSNVWSIEEHALEMKQHTVFDESGVNKSYFTDNDGNVFKDESGNTDNGSPIPWYVELGNNLFETEAQKSYHAVHVFSGKAKGTSIRAKINDRESIKVGEITENSQSITIPGKGTDLQGEYINYIISNNGQYGESVFRGLVSYYSLEQSNASRR